MGCVLDGIGCVWDGMGFDVGRMVYDVCGMVYDVCRMVYDVCGMGSVLLTAIPSDMTQRDVISCDVRRLTKRSAMPTCVLSLELMTPSIARPRMIPTVPSPACPSFGYVVCVYVCN